MPNFSKDELIQCYNWCSKRYEEVKVYIPEGISQYLVAIKELSKISGGCFVYLSDLREREKKRVDEMLILKQMLLELKKDYLHYGMNVDEFPV